MFIPSPRSTHRNSRLLFGLLPLALAGSAACSREPMSPEDSELRALLDDRELEGVIHQAQTASDGGAATGGTGGGTGMGGTGGSARPDASAPPDGGMGMGGEAGGGGCPPGS